MSDQGTMLMEVAGTFGAVLAAMMVGARGALTAVIKQAVDEVIARRMGPSIAKIDEVVARVGTLEVRLAWLCGRVGIAPDDGPAAASVPKPTPPPTTIGDP